MGAIIYRRRNMRYIAMAFTKNYSFLCLIEVRKKRLQWQKINGYTTQKNEKLTLNTSQSPEKRIFHSKNEKG